VAFLQARTTVHEAQEEVTKDKAGCTATMNTAYAFHLRTTKKSKRSYLAFTPLA